MNEKVGIYVNPAGQKQYKKQAVVLSEKIPNSVMHELRFPLKSIPDEEETVAVFGGDGSTNSIAEAMLKRNNPGLLIVVPAGSENGLYTALTDANSIVNLEQIRNKSTSHIPLFKPGSINGEIFNHIADLTKAGALQLKYAEAIRPFTPRSIRAFAGVAIGYVMIKNDKEYPTYEFKLLMTSPYFGKYKIIPEQNIYDETITLVTLQARNKMEGIVKSAALLFYLRRHKTPPETVAKISKEKSFTLTAYCSELNVDGELKTIPTCDTIFVARDKRALQAAALSLT